MSLNEVITQSITILIIMILLGMMLRKLKVLKEAHSAIFATFISSFFTMVMMVWLL